VRPHGAGGKFFIFDSFNMHALIPKSPFDFTVRFLLKGGLLNCMGICDGRMKGWKGYLAFKWSLNLKFASR
jgi:hypothetical protein